MKVLVVLLILGLVGVYANDTNFDDEKQITSSCFQQYGENLDALLDGLKYQERAPEEIAEKVTSYKMGCISSCYIRKRLPNNKLDFQDMVDHVLDSLNKVCMKGRAMDMLNICKDYKNYMYDSSTLKIYNYCVNQLAQYIFTEAEIDEFKDIAIKCIIEAKGDECRLFECLKPWNSPIGRVIDYSLHKY